MKRKVKVKSFSELFWAILFLIFFIASANVSIKSFFVEKSKYATQVENIYCYERGKYLSEYNLRIATLDGIFERPSDENCPLSKVLSKGDEIYVVAKGSYLMSVQRQGVDLIDYKSAEVSNSGGIIFLNFMSLILFIAFVLVFRGAIDWGTGRK